MDFDDDLARRLRAERPGLTPPELDRVRRRATASAGQTRPRRLPSVAVTACLGLGLAFTGAGTGMAVSGISGDGSPVSRQYLVPVTGVGTVTTSTDKNSTTGLTPPPTTTGEQGNPPLGGQGGTTPTDTDTGSQPGQTITDNGSTTTPADTTTTSGQPLKQVQATQATAGKLPFTGYAAIPVLLVGMALLGAGVLIRRRSNA